jgi:hypothetical protein
VPSLRGVLVSTATSVRLDELEALEAEIVVLRARAESRDGAGIAAERYRQENGIDSWYLGFAHTHPEDGNVLPSEADTFALRARTRTELGGIAVGLITARVVRGTSTDWMERMQGHIAQTGRTDLYPVAVVPGVALWRFRRSPFAGSRRWTPTH